MADKLIGVVGGMGSYAGLDLIKKIYDLTQAKNDRDHLPVAMISNPNETPDRSKFLLGETEINPAVAIAEIINRLVKVDAKIIGIPCNTAHAEPIFNEIKKRISSSCQLLHMVEEVGQYLNTNHPKISSAGILATTGTVFSGVYAQTLHKYGIDVIEIPEEIQNGLVNAAIYDAQYGIKALGNPVTEKARNDLMKAALYLKDKGAEVIILGCTEIPLAITETKIENTTIVDATHILASALIRESRSTKK